MGFSREAPPRQAFQPVPPVSEYSVRVLFYSPSNPRTLQFSKLHSYLVPEYCCQLHVEGFRRGSTLREAQLTLNMTFCTGSYCTCAGEVADVSWTLNLWTLIPKPSSLNPKTLERTQDLNWAELEFLDLRGSVSITGNVP